MLLTLGVSIVILSIYSIGVSVLLRNSRLETNRAFGIFACVLGTWLTANYIGANFKDYSIAVYAVRADFFLGPLLALSFWSFSMAFFKFATSSNPIWINRAVVSLSILLSIAGLTSVIASVDYTRFTTITYGQGYPLYAVGLAATAISGVVLLIKARIQAGSVLRKQINVLLLGVTIAAVAIMIANLLIPQLTESELLNLLAGNIAYIGVAVFIYSSGVAIVKHRLFDVRLFVARLVGYLLSVGVVTVLFVFISILIVSRLAGEELSLNLNGQLPYLIVVILLSIIFQPLKRFFDKLTNKVFYQDAYDAQEFLDEHNRVVVSNTEIEPMLRQCAEIISRNIKSEFCVFGLRETAYSSQRIIGTVDFPVDPEDIENLRKVTPHMGRSIIVADELEDKHAAVKSVMTKYNVAILARLAMTQEYEIEGLGYIVLGPKRSGNPYNKQDINIIEIIANELVIAIQNALRYEEIEKFTITLQEKVDEATRKLKATNTKLKAMDETKDEFISMASHQLRTPLTSVKGYLSMVLEGDAGELTDMQNKLLNQAFVSSQRMVYLIADLLNVSRLRTGKFVVETKPTDLVSAIEGEISQLKEVAAGRGLSLSFVPPTDFPELMLDETKIRQVIMNFTDNAIYYTPSGGKIDINLQETGESITFTVKDTGLGVPKSEQPQLFGKFYRAANARKARPDGTGLGLFMAKKVVVAQGGAIVFNSTEGKGSTFGFTFPKSKLMPPEIQNNQTTKAD